MERWYVVYTKPRQERIACSQLNNQGFDALLPLCQKEKLTAGKRVRISEVLFPRYVFIKPKSEHFSFSSVKYTKGVTDFVRFGGQLATVSDQMITELIARQNDVVAPLFSRGEVVEVCDGPFEGISAVFQLPLAEQRCEVLLQWLGRASLVSMPFAHIAKLS